MKAYKLTNSFNETKNNTLWGEGITHTAYGDPAQGLCSDGWIHIYIDPLIAVFMNPVHASFINPILWEGEAYEPIKHESLKSGCKSFTTIKQIPLPKITITQKVAFGILSSLEVCKDTIYKEWAQNWLNNKDRTATANYAAADATAAYYAAAHAAAAAYYTAAAAGDAAACAAHAADAADAAAYTRIDFVALAHKAMKY